MLVQIRGPVEPGLMFPAFDLALLNWRGMATLVEALHPTVRPQTTNSILGTSEKWSAILVRCIFVGSQCDIINSPRDAGIYTSLRGDNTPRRFVVQSNGTSSPELS